MNPAKVELVAKEIARKIMEGISLQKNGNWEIKWEYCMDEATKLLKQLEAIDDR